MTPDAGGAGAGDGPAHRILGTGLDYRTGGRLVGSFDEREFASGIERSLAENAPRLQAVARATQRATSFRGELARRPTVDLGDPKAAGWTFLVRDDDPRRADFGKALEPLARHRGMADPAQPLVFDGRDDWQAWLTDEYFALDLQGRQVPQYVAIVGGPDRVPFQFQSVLDSAASVGRLDFESLDELSAYVAKVVRLETAPSPAVERDVVCFAPDYGYDDPTYFSRRYMVEPLVEYVTTQYGIRPKLFVEEAATKAQLVSTLTSAKPAVVFTASHGMAAPDDELDVQKRVTGAICCQRAHASDPAESWLFTAADVPGDGVPFLEGAVFFQFACFGYGTPEESDYAHWLPDEFGVARRIAKADFVSALPKRLLAHPRGPVGFIGHVDMAWLHGFADPNDAAMVQRWSTRITPFKRALDVLLAVEPAGLALGDMNKRYDIGNAMLTNLFDQLQRKKLRMTPELQQRLADTFITRGDAQNYMVFGDPAACLRIPQP